MDRVTVALGWAAQHADNGRTSQSSALVALADARYCAERGDSEGAIRRALDSLCHSLGWYDERVKVVASWVRQCPLRGTEHKMGCAVNGGAACDCCEACS